MILQFLKKARRGPPKMLAASDLAATTEAEASPAIPDPAREPPGTGVDLLASPATRVFHLELTSRCNLRCVYCAVSQPGYVGADMATDDFDGIVAGLLARRVSIVTVNGHGETTLIPGWHERINRLAEAGFRLSIISNFARLLTEPELAAMARIRNIQVSVDTHRPEVLRAVRRRVDLGNILINMAAVSATAERLGLPRPSYSWSCVVSDRVALDLVDYVRFGLVCGVRDFTLCNLTKYDDVEGAQNVNHVTTMPAAALARFADLLREVGQIIEAAGGSLTVQAGLVDSIDGQLVRSAAA